MRTYTWQSLPAPKWTFHLNATLSDKYAYLVDGSQLPYTAESPAFTDINTARLFKRNPVTNSMPYMDKNYFCPNIKNVIIDTKASIIKEFALTEMMFLRKLIIPQYVKHLSISVCEELPMLTSVQMSKVEIIDENVFKDCKLLEKISFGNALTEIKTDALANCGLLYELNFANAPITAITPGDFNTWGLVNSSSTWTSPLKRFVFPKATVTLAEGTFYNHPTITEIDLSKATLITSIPSGFCSISPHLNKVIVPPTLTSIPSGTLWGCPELDCDYINTKIIPKLTVLEDASFNASNTKTVFERLTLGAQITSIGDAACLRTNNATSAIIFKYPYAIIDYKCTSVIPPANGLQNVVYNNISHPTLVKIPNVNDIADTLVGELNVSSEYNSAIAMFDVNSANYDLYNGCIIPKSIGVNLNPASGSSIANLLTTSNSEYYQPCNGKSIILIELSEPTSVSNIEILTSYTYTASENISKLKIVFGTDTDILGSAKITSSLSDFQQISYSDGHESYGIIFKCAPTVAKWIAIYNTDGSVQNKFSGIRVYEGYYDYSPTFIEMASIPKNGVHHQMDLSNTFINPINYTSKYYIDWGDGTLNMDVDITDLSNLKHTYTSSRYYYIKTNIIPTTFNITSGLVNDLIFDNTPAYAYIYLVGIVFGRGICAFSGNTVIGQSATYLELPHTIASIPSIPQFIAFSYNSIQRLYIEPGFLTNSMIPALLFGYSDNLIDINIPVDISNIGPFAFYYSMGGNWLTTYYTQTRNLNLVTTDIYGNSLEQNLSTISERAFAGSKINIPNALYTYIHTYGIGAFADATLVGNIPLSIYSDTVIGNGVFDGCFEITGFTVSNSTYGYQAINGILYKQYEEDPSKLVMIAFPFSTTEVDITLPINLYNCASTFILGSPVEKPSIGLTINGYPVTKTFDTPYGYFDTHRNNSTIKSIKYFGEADIFSNMWLFDITRYGCLLWKRNSLEPTIPEGTTHAELYDKKITNSAYAINCQLIGDVSSTTGVATDDNAFITDYAELTTCYAASTEEWDYQVSTVSPCVIIELEKLVKVQGIELSNYGTYAIKASVYYSDDDITYTDGVLDIELAENTPYYYVLPESGETSLFNAKYIKVQYDLSDVSVFNRHHVFVRCPVAFGIEDKRNPKNMLADTTGLQILNDVSGWDTTGSLTSDISETNQWLNLVDDTYAGLTFSSSTLKTLDVADKCLTIACVDDTDIANYTNADGLTTYTMYALVKVPSETTIASGSYVPIMGSLSSASGVGSGWGFSKVKSTGYVRAMYGTSTSSGSTSTIYANTWTVVAITSYISGSTKYIKLFINGVQKTNTSTSSAYLALRNLDLGKLQYSSSSTIYASGNIQIKHFSLFNINHTADQVLLNSEYLINSVE